MCKINVEVCDLTRNKLVYVSLRAIQAQDGIIISFSSSIRWTSNHRAAKWQNVRCDNRGCDGSKCICVIIIHQNVCVKCGLLIKMIKSFRGQEVTTTTKASGSTTTHSMYLLMDYVARHQHAL